MYRLLDCGDWQRDLGAPLAFDPQHAQHRWASLATVCAATGFQWAACLPAELLLLSDQPIGCLFFQVLTTRLRARCRRARPPAPGACSRPAPRL